MWPFDSAREKISVQPQCRQNALRNALTLAEKYGWTKVFIFGGKDSEGRYHCQTAVSIDGKDVWFNNQTCEEGEKEVVEGQPYPISVFIRKEWPSLMV